MDFSFEWVFLFLGRLVVPNLAWQQPGKIRRYLLEEKVGVLFQSLFPGILLIPSNYTHPVIFWMQRCPNLLRAVLIRDRLLRGIVGPKIGLHAGSALVAG